MKDMEEQTMNLFPVGQFLELFIDTCLHLTHGWHHSKLHTALLSQMDLFLNMQICAAKCSKLRTNICLYRGNLWCSVEKSVSTTETHRTHSANLSDLFIVFIKWLAVFPVEECGNANNFFLLVDNGQRQDILNEKTRLIHSLFLKDIEIECFKSVIMHQDGII